MGLSTRITQVTSEGLGTISLARTFLLDRKFRNIKFGFEFEFEFDLDFMFKFE